jgi:hypothetical protein
MKDVIMIYDVVLRYEIEESIPVEADDEADAEYTAKQILREGLVTPVYDITVMNIEKSKG